MTEPTITCPQCGTEIKVTESLAAPLVESTRREFEQRLAKKEAEAAGKEAALRAREEALAEEKAAIDQQVEAKLKQERGKIAAEEEKKARRVLGDELEQRAKEVGELQQVLKQREEKLAQAQQTQAELLRKERELEDAKRELDLTVEKRVQQGLDATRVKARQEAEEQLGLKVQEKEETIASMQRQIEELKRRAEQGSQQLQGEVLELELEASLRARFPLDRIEPVPKGEHGGDVVHRVVNDAAVPCGTILWESKRTKHWSDGWLVKLRDDQRAARAELCVIVSRALPKGVETFDHVDGVWIVQPRLAIPVAQALRQTLLETAMARTATEGQQTKMGLVYDYLTGPQFRRRVEAIVEAFTSMKDDLEREKKASTKQWAKRETQIERVMQATVGMYGDRQGIAGRSLGELEGVGLKALEAAPEDVSEAGETTDGGAG
jgi:hypothetical protein